MFMAGADQYVTPYSSISRATAAPTRSHSSVFQLWRKRGADGERRRVLVQRLVLRRGVKILTDARRQVAHDVVYILSAAEAQAAMLVQRRHAQKAQARGAVGKVDVRNALVGEFVRRAADGAGV